MDHRETPVGVKSKQEPWELERAMAEWSRADKGLRAIMALGSSGEAGLSGRLPWDLPEELAWFKRATEGQALVFGRSTWEAMGSRLPGRSVAALSRSPSWAPRAGASAAGSWAQARSWGLDQNKPVCVCGGPSVWRGCWSEIDLAWVTRVEGPMDADFFLSPIGLRSKGWAWGPKELSEPFRGARAFGRA